MKRNRKIYFYCWRVIAVGYLFFSCFMLLYPLPHKILPKDFISFSWLHFAAFAFLGFAFEMGRLRFSLLVMTVLLLLYGPITEWLQPFTGRYFEWIDIVEDTLGVLAGIGLGLGIKRIPFLRPLYQENATKETGIPKNVLEKASSNEENPH